MRFNSFTCLALIALFACAFTQSTTGQSPFYEEAVSQEPIVNNDWATLEAGNGIVPREQLSTTLSFFGGWNFPDHRDTVGRYNYPRTFLEWSGTAGFAIGKRYGARIRSELEFSWRNNQASSNYNYFYPFALSILPPYSDERGFQGELNTYSGMVNFIFDFDRAPNRLLTPYAGAGIGLAYLDSDISYGGIGPTISNETALAYQAIGGVALKLTQRADFYAEYRYFATASAEFTQPSHYNGFSAVREINFVNSIQTHDLILGLRLHF